MVKIYDRKKLDLLGNESESADEGETMSIWLERSYKGESWTVPCTVDRMLMLHADGLDGKDFVVCKSQKVPRHYRHYLYMTIDNGEPMYGGHIDLYEGHAPSVSYFYPGNSAPARSRAQNDYDGVFYTRWFDSDDNTDLTEDESFITHWIEDRNQFQNCENPIAIEVYDLDNLRSFENSVNQNSDGRPLAEWMDEVRGFKCSNNTQTVNPKTGELPKCPNTKVRYKCLPGIVQMKGRIYTDKHGRADDPNFHVNRLQQTPLIRDESGESTI